MAQQSQGSVPPTLSPEFSSPLPWSNIASNILAVCITLTSLCWVTTIGRLWTRLVVIKKPWWDDFVVVLAVLSFTLMTIVTCVATKFGTGKHITQVLPQNLSKIVLCQYIWGIGYSAATGLIKLSLLLQYLRVFEDGTYTYRFTQGLFVLISLWAFAFTFISVFSCFPSPSAFWNMTYKGCYGFASPNAGILTNTIKGHAASNFFWDMLVLLLAVRLQFLSEVQSNRKSMAVLLMMGLLSCSFALWRLIDVAKTGAGAGQDPTFNEPGPVLLSTAEIYLAASCATIPFFWPVIKDQFNKIFVKYEFNVSYESQLPDEELELVNVESLPASSRRGEPQLADSASQLSRTDTRTKQGYDNVFIQEQVAYFDSSKKVPGSGTTAIAVPTKTRSRW